MAATRTNANPTTGEAIETRLPTNASRQWKAWTSGICGWTYTGSTSTLRPLSRRRFAKWLAARRSASVPVRRFSNEQSSRIVRMRSSTGTSGELSPPAQRFGPMKRSMAATESRRATEMFQRFIRRHSIPRRSQYSQKIPRMSSEWFVNW